MSGFVLRAIAIKALPHVHFVDGHDEARRRGGCEAEWNKAAVGQTTLLVQDSVGACSSGGTSGADAK